MGLYKQCACTPAGEKTWQKCDHPWWLRAKKIRTPLWKWAKLPPNYIFTKAELKKLWSDFYSSVYAGTSHRGKRPENYDIKALIQEYLTDYYLPKGREYERKEKYRFAAIEKKFGTVKPEDLGTIDVERWVNVLRKEGKGPAAIKRYVARLKAILNWGFERELFPTLRVRWKALELEAEGEGRARRLEEGEEEALKTAASPWLRQLIEAALDTGLRAGAILGLTFGMVEARGLVVPRRLLKNKRATHDLVMPLTARVRAIIEFRRTNPEGEEQPADAFIFGNTWGRKRRSFQGAWDAARKGAKIPRLADGSFNLHWHDLRGEFATRLHEAGVAIETISYLLDHSTVEMTRRYLKIRERSVKPAEAIKALEQFTGTFVPPKEEEPKAEVTIQ